MKSLRKALCVAMLMLSLASSALAGEIQHPIAPPAPPTANGEIQHPVTSDGETLVSASESTPGATDTLTEATLTLLQGLLALI